MLTHPGKQTPPVKEQSTEERRESSVTWASLEAFAREQIRTWLQRLLDAEVEGLVGRPRYGRRAGVDTAAGYRNGYGKPRRVTLSVGTIAVRRRVCACGGATSWRRRPRVPERRGGQPWSEAARGSRRAQSR